MTAPTPTPPVPPPPPAASGVVAPGWYADPWQVAPWRWWDGHMWTGHVEGGGHKPRLPDWLSVPVVLAVLPTLLAVVFYLGSAPASVALGFVPMVIVVPTLLWLDRVEPEPHTALVHSFLWGATVAVLISGTVNSIVAAAVGIEAAAVLSAPVVEEITKGLAVLVAVRRHHVDGLIDGVIYAGWAAIGFAVVEDFQYFASAEQADALAEVFVIRGLLTPFAHPLFTFWIGLFVGLAIERRRSVAVNFVVGLVPAMLSHAAWNGALSAADAAGVLIAIVAFIALFATVVVSLIRVRQRERRLFVAVAPMLATRYGLTPAELEVFSDWGRMLSARRRLSRPERRRFDEVHGALARLVLLHARGGAMGTPDEARLVHLLHTARTT